MSTEILILTAVEWIYLGIYFAVGVMGAIGGAEVLTIRSDAFDAAGRKPRSTWAFMLFGSGLVLIFPFFNLQILYWIGAVIIGVYWLDVRPHVRDIASGNYSW